MLENEVSQYHFVNFILQVPWFPQVECVVFHIVKQATVAKLHTAFIFCQWTHSDRLVHGLPAVLDANKT